MNGGWVYFAYVVTDTRDEGQMQAPLAGPDPTSSRVLRFSAPYGGRVVRWVAAARGDWPDVPAVASFISPNLKPLRSERNAHSPILCDKDVFIHYVAGTYVYALIAARPADADFSVGGLPTSIVPTVPGGDLFMPAAKFVRFLDTGKMY